jgi:Ca2+/H+ antiporter
MVQLSMEKLKGFVEDEDQNLKYLGLLAMGNFMKVCVCMCVCMYVCILYKHTHTHTHSLTHSLTHTHEGTPARGGGAQGHDSQVPERRGHHNPPARARSRLGHDQQKEPPRHRAHPHGPR